jgi:hypothetical protein
MMPKAQGNMVAKLAAQIARLNIIVPVDWLKEIDDWRKHQPFPPPSRSEAIRTLVSQALRAGKGKPDKSDKKHKA